MRNPTRSLATVVLQEEIAECGIACVSMIARLHGTNLSINYFRRNFPSSLLGTSVSDLKRIFSDIGFLAEAFRGEPNDLTNNNVPCILHWGMNHYVVLKKISRRRGRKFYHIIDPAFGPKSIDSVELSRNFTGVFLEAHLERRIEPPKKEFRLSLGHIMGQSKGVYSSIAQVVALAIIAQAAVLTGPLLLEICVDNIIPSRDYDLLTVTCLGFAAMGVLGLLSGLVRSLIVADLRRDVSLAISSSAFSKVLTLPGEWFQKRQIGDIYSRFSGIGQISEQISNGLASIFVDSLVLVGSLVFVGYFSTLAFWVSICAVVLSLGVRVGLISAMRFYNVSVLSTNARENSLFIDIVRSIETVRAFSGERHRHGMWRRAKAAAVDAEFKSARLSAIAQSVDQVISVGARVTVIYIAVRSVLAGDMTIGAVFALEMYRGQFFDSSGRVIVGSTAWYLSKNQARRLSDIVEAESDVGMMTRNSLKDPRADVIGSSIRAYDLVFSYSSSGQYKLKVDGINIKAGENIAIIGESGSGKSTLAKLLMGVVFPQQGVIEIDGVPLSAQNVRAWRSEIGSVMQGDRLFGGPIWQNICPFEEAPNFGRMREVADLARIDVEIMKLPLGYDTVIGEIGSILSGGQQQRILLARAMYPNPRLLIFDEATSNLDERTAAAIAETISSLKCTRVSIVHRREAVRAPDQVIRVEGGVVHVVM